MKKAFLVLVAGAFLIATPSCKKGENDPFMSLSSRKARLSGDWELSDYSATQTVDYSNGDKQVVTSTYSSGTINTANSYTPEGGSTTTTNSVITINAATYTINKDGTFTSEFNTTSVSEYSYNDIWTGDDHTVVSTTVSTQSTTGNWSFVNKLKGEYKNKERVVLNTLTDNSTSQTTTVDNNDTQGTESTSTGDMVATTTNYSTGEQSETWDIDQLKGKEMIWKMTGSQSGSQSITPDGGSTTTTQDDTENWDITITMTAVK